MFLGPSLRRVEAEKFLYADYRPPVRRGDLVKLPPGTIVGMVDGVFDQELAVSPREVLSAVRRGVRVFGSSSMGALRAAEVPGVVGVGKIYQMFRSGLLEDDDEVALVFERESWRSLSEPMVNIRYAVERLVTPGTIDRESGSTIVAVAKRLPYPERNYQRILDEAGLGTKRDATQLIGMLRSYDLKRDDAISLLERIANDVEPNADEPSSRTVVPFMNDEDDRPDSEQARDVFSVTAPVMFWEFGETIEFHRVVQFLTLTGEILPHARAVVARLALRGIPFCEDLSRGPSLEESTQRVMDRLAAEWGLLTDEEVRVTLADCGLGAQSLESSLDDEISSQRMIRALVREGSEVFFAALRAQLFLDNLALKRAAARLGSLDFFARRATATPLTEQELAGARSKLCHALDVRDSRGLSREALAWGIDETALSTQVELIARARRAAQEHRAEQAKNRKASVSLPRNLRSRRKPKGEPRFSVDRRTAASAARRLRDVVGITRVAVITGLSDMGIPNAQAFRPDGHFSSTVGSGKSESAVGARIGAIMEEVEKWTQERYALREAESGDRSASFLTLRNAGRRRECPPPVDPCDLDLPFDSCYQPGLEMDWRECTDLVSGNPALVPRAALTMERLPCDIYFSPRAGRKVFGTNGLASGFTREDAICHALCEYIERHGDVVNEVLDANPGGSGKPNVKVLDNSTLLTSTVRLLRKIERTGRRVRIFDIRADVLVPTFRVRISTPAFGEEDLFGVTHHSAWGKASHPNPEVAVNMAILEAVQSVMTVTAGAREDLTVRSRSLGRHERTVAATRPAFASRNADAELPTVAFCSVDGLVSNDVREDIRWTVERVRDAGYPRVLVCDLTAEEIRPAVVVRVLIPGLETVNPFRTGVVARMGLLTDLLHP